MSKNKNIIIVILLIILLLIVVCFYLRSHLYTNTLSSVDSVYFDKIEVSDNEVRLEGGTFDSGLMVQKVQFEVVDDVLQVYVYKGLITDKNYNGFDVKYESDTAEINKIVLMGANENIKEIWERQSKQ